MAVAPPPPSGHTIASYVWAGNLRGPFDFVIRYLWCCYSEAGVTAKVVTEKHFRTKYGTCTVHTHTQTVGGEEQEEEAGNGNKKKRKMQSDFKGLKHCCEIKFGLCEIFSAQSQQQQREGLDLA